MTTPRATSTSFAAKPRQSATRSVKLLTGGNPQIAKADGDELDEAQLPTWIRQAAALPGWMPQRNRRHGTLKGALRGGEHDDDGMVSGRARE